MEKMFRVFLCLLAAVLFAGCGERMTHQEGTTMIANPWSTWDSIEEAESAVGFSFGLPDVIAGSYEAVSICTMNDELIEVTYRDEDYEVCVRKKAGEGQDISGDYHEYETCTETTCQGVAVVSYRNSNDPAVKQLVRAEGYSWSLVAPNGYWGDSSADFVNGILGE